MSPEQQAEVQKFLDEKFSDVNKEAAKPLVKRAPSLIGQLLDQRLEWEAKLNHLIRRLVAFQFW